MPKGYDLPCRHREIRHKQEPCPEDCRTKIVLGQCPHRSPEWHKLSFRYKKKMETNSSQVLTIKPLTHIKVERKAWAVAGF